MAATLGPPSHWCMSLQLVLLYAQVPAATVQVNNQPDVLFAVLHVKHAVELMHALRKIQT